MGKRGSWRAEGDLKGRMRENSTLCTYMYEGCQRMNYKMFNLCYISSLSYMKLSPKKRKETKWKLTHWLHPYEANTVLVHGSELRTLLPSAGHPGTKLVSEVDFKLIWGTETWRYSKLCILYRTYNWCSKEETRKKPSLQNSREKWPTGISWWWRMTVLDCLCPPKSLWLPGPPMPTQGSLLPGCPSCLLLYHHSLPGTPPCRCTFFPAIKLFSFYSAWSLLCSPGWPWTHWDPPASAPKAHTMSGSFLLLLSVVTCLVILFFFFFFLYKLFPSVGWVYSFSPYLWSPNFFWVPSISIWGYACLFWKKK